MGGVAAPNLLKLPPVVALRSPVAYPHRTGDDLEVSEQIGNLSLRYRLMGLAPSRPRPVLQFSQLLRQFLGSNPVPVTEHKPDVVQEFDLDVVRRHGIAVSKQPYYRRANPLRPHAADDIPDSEQGS